MILPGPNPNRSYTVYAVSSDDVDGVYVGITINCRTRWSMHKTMRHKSSLAPWSLMRQHGVQSFSMMPLCNFDSFDDARSVEDAIMFAVVASGGTLWNVKRHRDVIDRATRRMKKALEESK